MVNTYGFVTRSTEVGMPIRPSADTNQMPFNGGVKDLSGATDQDEGCTSESNYASALINKLEPALPG